MLVCVHACWYLVLLFFLLAFEISFHGLCYLMDKSIPFPEPDPCRRRNSRLPLSILQLVWKLFLTKYVKHLCATSHLEAFAKVPLLFSFLLSVSWQIWWITQSSSEMWPSVAISTMARWENFLLLGTGFLFLPAHFFSLQSHKLGFEAIMLDLLTQGGLHA